MNIERFIEVRKALNLSQMELAEGICTQVTLSRFENNGQVPNLKILIKLCNRLNLPLGELFPKVGVKYTEATEKMNKAEFFLITSEYDQASDLLQSIAVSEIEENSLALRFHYLNGFIMIAQQVPVTDVLFTFDQILLSDKDDVEIYRLLAYTGIGMVYSREKKLEKAEFYFSKVLEKIYAYPINTMEDVWRVLNIVFQSGTFFAQIDEIELSNALLSYAVSICSDNHVTYYLARAAIQLAKNAIIQEKPQQEVLELIHDARAYSKINKNTIALKELEQLESEILSGNLVKE
ncbi:helix-turn-helix domain-containing protein [Trichococcus pasteurii]|uniref:Tetratricopeptide tpr1 n=1 Tax=Trichococcus pasteurii TaxID=43064 RepID=A0A1W1IF80_9LACT|nr:helix-turn-helix transcriptional regulator [Trichococcus pasteurii]SFE12740.1 Helix-turn-helix domain-containing protein [Trichococcus pasteurii]SLM51423.1 tetratricopeptide tpr1 [Trichococcus pasteurii]SSB92304.1 tetratricopeptide tpr1 [Trichococcus pasteurii]